MPLPDPAVTAAIRKKYAGKKKAPLAVTMRDRLGEWMTDELFAGAFGVRGRPGESLAVVTVLQFAYDLGDREATEAVATRLDCSTRPACQWAPAGKSCAKRRRALRPARGPTVKSLR